MSRAIALSLTFFVLGLAVLWGHPVPAQAPVAVVDPLDELLKGETPLDYEDGVREGERRALEATSLLCRLVGVRDGDARDVALVDNPNGNECAGVAEAMNRRWPGEAFGCVCP